MELVWSSLAKEQLRNVLSYVEEEYGYRIAQKTLLNISQKVNQLLSYPERGILDAKLKVELLRLMVLMRSNSTFNLQPSIFHSIPR